MLRARIICLLFVVYPLVGSSVPAQTDDVRMATGLPIPIGAQVIYGKVSLNGIKSNEPKPTIFVTLLFGGAQVERVQTNDKGYYYFLRAPADGMSVVVEVNNSEVGRTVLSGGTGSSVRQDLTVQWMGDDSNVRASVVSVRDSYPRSPEANKLFDEATAAAKAKDYRRAAEKYKRIVVADPKDHVAATELGTVYYSDGKKAEGEAAYKMALASKPDFMPALMNLGKLYFGDKRFEDAAATFYEAVKADRSSSDAFEYLGESYLQMKQGSKAVIAFGEALRLDPTGKAEVHLRLAALYIAAGARDRASIEYQQYLVKRPDSRDKSKMEQFIKDNPPKQ